MTASAARSLTLWCRTMPVRTLAGLRPRLVGLRPVLLASQRQRLARPRRQCLTRPGARRKVSRLGRGHGRRPARHSTGWPRRIGPRNERGLLGRSRAGLRAGPRVLAFGRRRGDLRGRCSLARQSALNDGIARTVARLGLHPTAGMIALTDHERAARRPCAPSARARGADRRQLGHMIDHRSTIAVTDHHRARRHKADRTAMNCSHLRH